MGRSFPAVFAGRIRGRRASYMRQIIRWQWHLDEVFVKINGETHCLWRAVDHEDEVLESFVTKTRHKTAALRLLRDAMKRYGSPCIVVTDRLRSYGTAMKTIGNVKRQEVGRQLNNRAQNIHLPFRRRERAMSRFRRMSNLQKFASTHASFHNHFNLEISATPDTNIGSAVAKDLGLPTRETLERVIRTVAYVRNICANHGRLWNRRLVKRIPKLKRFGDDLSVEKIGEQAQPENYIYNVLVVLCRMLLRQSLDTSFPARVAALITARPGHQQLALGFPANWESPPVWTDVND